MIEAGRRDVLPVLAGGEHAGDTVGAVLTMVQLPVVAELNTCSRLPSAWSPSETGASW